MKNKKEIIFFLTILTVTIFGLIFMGSQVYAAPANIPIPKVNLSIDNGGSPQNYVDNIKLLIVLTILTLLPSFIVMMTSFVRTIVVFGF